MNRTEQLDLWLQGEPKCPTDDGQHCPDHSCCHSKCLAPLKMRKIYIRSDEEGRLNMEMMWEVALDMLKEGADVHIVDISPPLEDH